MQFGFDSWNKLYWECNNPSNMVIDEVARQYAVASCEEQKKECAGEVEESGETIFKLTENDFVSTVVPKGYHYLVKTKAGAYKSVWYNYHGQWMIDHPDGERTIDKIYTPHLK